jgi:hypothetical protein
MPNLAGAISSLLMSLPLIAVPCLAVFGLPSIGPATAEAEADDSIELGAPKTATADALGVAAEQPPASADFSPIVDAASTATPDAAFVAGPRADRQSIDRTSDRRGASANHAAGIGDEPANPPRPATASLGAATSGLENPFADVQPPAAPEATSPRKTAALEDTPAQTQGSWEQVIARLKGKGAEEFYLANGEIDGEFYFTCFFDTGNNTTQRFEAEGATPLDAASTVLAEVEEWQGTR